MRRPLALALPGLLLALGVVAWLALEGNGTGRTVVEEEGEARAPSLSGRGEAPTRVDPAAREAEDALAPQQATWTGTVTDEQGRPVEGAWIVVEALVTARMPIMVSTDARGAFRHTAPARQGTMAVYAGAPGFLPVRIETSRRGQEGIAFRLPPDRVRAPVVLEVVTEEGKPAAGVAGWARTDESDVALPPGWQKDLRTALDFDGATLRAGWTRVAFHTDAEGRAMLPARLPGPLRVRAVQDGRYLDAAVQVASPPAENRFRVALARARRVTGLVRVQKDPAWSCSHASHRFEVYADDATWERLGAVEEDGRLAVDVPVPLRRLRVETAGKGHPPVEVVLPSEPLDVDIGEVKVPDARAVSGAIRFANGVPAARVTLRYGEGEGARVATDAEGRFRIEALPRPSRRDRVTIEVPGRSEPIPIDADLSKDPLEVTLPADVAPPEGE